MVAGLSLANKIQFLFGFAVVAILTVALGVPWIRTHTLVREFQVEEARRIADAWLADRIDLGRPLSSAGDDAPDVGPNGPSLRLRYLSIDRVDLGEASEGFAAEAARAFLDDPERREHVAVQRVGGRTVYRYARAIRESTLRSMRRVSMSVFSGPPIEPGVADPLRAVLVVDRDASFADGQLLRVRIFILAAGLVGGLLAILVFHVIMTKVIFRPVRRLRETTEQVEAGNLAIRSDIRTGDEFEQLASALNSMLDRLGASQAELRALNETLDLRVDELAQANVGLHESNRLKSEFLASVSHELRTPLNSIIGFAELLQELARNDAAADPKRLRYLANIVTSGRSLLEMINELLDMAKIEAGRMEVSLEQVALGDLLEGLLRIMRPQAEAKSIQLSLSMGGRVPVVETDPGKLQQILYNFLSNAIKFTPGGGSVVLAVDRVNRSDHQPGVRISVADTGPGIAEDMHDVIFDKFRQIDAGHTREHAGTGLGLAICRELATMLGATVSFVSAPGRGSTFFVDLPLTFKQPEPMALME